MIRCKEKYKVQRLLEPEKLIKKLKKTKNQIAYDGEECTGLATPDQALETAAPIDQRHLHVPIIICSKKVNLSCFILV